MFKFWKIRSNNDGWIYSVLSLVKSGNFFRIESLEGPQVGDLNLFQLNNLNEKFYSGKTRALYGTHISVGDKLFSNLPYLQHYLLLY